MKLTTPAIYLHGITLIKHRDIFTLAVSCIARDTQTILMPFFEERSRVVPRNTSILSLCYTSSRLVAQYPNTVFVRFNLLVMSQQDEIVGSDHQYGLCFRHCASQYTAPETGLIGCYFQNKLHRSPVHVMDRYSLLQKCSWACDTRKYCLS
jgi:hypothetical protein